MKIGKPRSVYVNVQDRKDGKFKTLTVYGMTHKEAVSRIRKALAEKKR